MSVPSGKMSGIVSHLFCILISVQMEMKKTRYMKIDIMEHYLTSHLWICRTLTESECRVLELLVKGYTVTQISKMRSRSVKTVSLQKHRVYKKLCIRNDVTFWLDLFLSPYVKIKLEPVAHYREGER
ncbi:TPA: helix-turn-helix transcriptional regulator [Salmonella enterica subsp. enterica serovar Typhimurium]